MSRPVILVNGVRPPPIGDVANGVVPVGSTMALSLQSTAGITSAVWAFEKVPEGSTCAPASATSLSTSATFDLPGEYILTCRSQSGRRDRVVLRVYTAAHDLLITQPSDDASTLHDAVNRTSRAVDNIVAAASQTQHVANLTALRAVVPEANAGVILAGRTTRGDGGGGTFFYDPSDTTTADDGALTVVASGGKRMKRIREGLISVRWFGAKGDGVTDDTTAVQAALTACASGGVVYFPPGVYLTSGVLYASNGNVTLRGDGPSSVIRASATSFNLLEIRADDVHVERLFFQGPAVDGTTAQYAIWTSATAARADGSGAAFETVANLETLTFKVDGSSLVTVTFVTGDDTPKECMDRINAAVRTALGARYGYVCVPGYYGPQESPTYDQLSLVSPLAGAGSSVEVVGGTARAKLGFAIGTSTGSGYRAQRCKVHKVRFGGVDAAHAVNNAIKISTACDGWLVDDCDFTLAGYDGGLGSGYGVLVGAAADWTVTNCRALWSTFGGRHFVYVAGGCNRGIIRGNHVSKPNSNAVSMLSYNYQPPCVGVLIEGNRFEEQVLALTDSAPIACYGRQHEHVFRGNQVSDAVRFGIVVSCLGFEQGACSDITVEDNTIVRPGQIGIQVLGAVRVSVRKNTIHDASWLNTGTYAAISVASHPDGAPTIADRIVVESNRITNSGTPRYRDGIRLEPNANAPTNARVANNVIAPGTYSAPDCLLVYSATATGLVLDNNTAETPKTYTAADTSPSVLGTRYMEITNAGATNLDQLDEGHEGQEVQMHFTDGNTTVRNETGGAGRIRLAGAANWTPTAGMTLKVRHRLGIWYEIARAA